MADSIDRKVKKSKISRDLDLDALLDEAEIPVTPVDNSQEDEDAIDRLLMDAGFEADEKLPEMIDDTDYPAGYDEFGDDFDLADISTDLRDSAEINLADDIKTDSDFPLDLIDSIAITPDENSNTFNATDDDDDLEAFPLHGLQRSELEQANEEGLVIDDSSLTDELDEFSDFSAFSDVQQAELNADDSPGSSFSTTEDSSEVHDDIEETPEFSGLVMDDDELIVDIAELEAIDQAIEHDEFGDDLDGPYGTDLDSAAQIDSDQQSEAEQTTRVDNDFGVPSADYDITADFDDELIDNLQQTGALLDEQTVQEIDRQAAQPKAVPDETIIGKAPEKSPENTDAPIDAAGIAALLQFKSDQEAINKKYKKQIADFETKAKKSAMITYIAVGFGLTSLITAVVMGVMAYSAKTEITKLTELAGAQGKGKSGVADTQKQHQEIAPKAKLNHEADKTIEDSKLKQEVPQELKPDHTAAEPIHEAENTAHNAKVLTPESPAPATSMEQSQIPPVPEKHEKPETAEVSHQSESKPLEQPKEPVASLTKQAPQTEVSSTSTSAGSIKKDIPAVPEKKQVSERKADEHQERKAEIAVKQKKTITTPKKAAAKKEPKKLSAVSDWSVNLIAYKQQWYASSKAAEFAQKGVPVEILPVKINNVTWYRLRVGGFNNREEASLYAGRVKKALNLSSVWVGNK